MLDGVMVDYYGVPTPIAQTANINTPDPRQIIVQPWDKSILGLIEKAIMAANLGLTLPTKVKYCVLRFRPLPSNAVKNW